jgi:4-hydroxy-tetrahydrodipicolinate reductase
MIKVLLIGAMGKLGTKIVENQKKVEGIEIFQKIGSPTSSLPSCLTKELLSTVQIALDVSTPPALEENLPKIVERNIPLVIGSTGHNEIQIDQIQKAASFIPILITPNFSPGIAYIQHLLKTVPIGNYKIEESHRKEKKDTPSGTALALASVLPSPPVISSIREGDIIGEHRIFISLPHEELEIRHTALSRDLFAIGALHACHFLYNKPPGLYTSIYDQNR